MKNNNTGWSKKTVNCNFIVTGVKFTKYGKTQLFLEMVYREVLIFWCLNNVKWKQSCLSRLCQNSGLASDWLNHTWRKESLVVCQCLLGVCLRLMQPFKWIGDCLWDWVYRYVSMSFRGSVVLRSVSEDSFHAGSSLAGNKPTNLAQHQKARLFSTDAL